MPAKQGGRVDADINAVICRGNTDGVALGAELDKDGFDFFPADGVHLGASHRVVLDTVGENAFRRDFTQRDHIDGSGSTVAIDLGYHAD